MPENIRRAPRAPLMIVTFAFLAALAAGCALMGSGETQAESTPESVVVAGAELRAFGLLATDLVRAGRMHSNDAERVLAKLEEGRKVLGMINAGVDENGDPLSVKDGLARFHLATSIALAIMGPLVQPGGNP